ncbi:AbrB/MazE/SpoVT family DNA-binding domain-containing protein [Salinibacter ruber]|uniref:AbrB/MazE/SpoVT family DNA-binding domain-containing protein n=1 Tax=Salinibacter ruber TaxID=146919 RepID=UPI002166DD9B|nr:AbrB/MazE/SpoVT family DNA-binding domain-containing protein [Salinibacter ruber]MCS4039963.1 AbrB family looped-hinge helix DNA binding protein [Salinibacter ruber]
MPTSTLTSRGQTTIPKPIREAPGLQPGDRVEFTLAGDRVLVRRAGADLSSLDGMLGHFGQEPVSIEDMNEAIQEAASENVMAPEVGGGEASLESTRTFSSGTSRVIIPSSTGPRSGILSQAVHRKTRVT